MILGSTTEERRLVSNAQDEPYGVHPSIVKSVPAPAPSEDDAVLRAGDDDQVVHAPGYGDQATMVVGRYVKCSLSPSAGSGWI